jgi:shikimate kinase
MATSIILIGPLGAGKTTVSALLAQKLGWTVVEVDAKRTEYRTEIGYDENYAEKLLQEEGFLARLAYGKPFEIHSVERVIQDYPENHVISFGAGNSVYDNEEYLTRAKQALANIQYVILLLPSPDIEESLRILTERLRLLIDPDALDAVTELNRIFIQHPSNEALATVTFYNADQTPEATAEAIFKYIQSTT